MIVRKILVRKKPLVPKLSRRPNRLFYSSVEDRKTELPERVEERIPDLFRLQSCNFFTDRWKIFAFRVAEPLPKNLVRTRLHSIEGRIQIEEKNGLEVFFKIPRDVRVNLSEHLPIRQRMELTGLDPLTPNPCRAGGFKEIRIFRHEPGSSQTPDLNQELRSFTSAFMKKTRLERLAETIHDCARCPRLVAYTRKIAKEKRRAYQAETYAGRPVSGFGDPAARLVLVGLAPAAHGANRTGRVFTGDRSGDWLYRALHKSGFANQPESHSQGDGLKLRDAWVTCSVRCAPPGNKPTPTEFKNCRPYLNEELDLLESMKVALALGAIALETLYEYFRERNLVLEKTKWKFGHGKSWRLRDGRLVLASFHPSQQNTFTGRLTETMFDSVFARARDEIKGSRPKALRR